MGVSLSPTLSRLSLALSSGNFIMHRDHFLAISYEKSRAMFVAYRLGSGLYAALMIDDIITDDKW